jgi:hypothetical protein
MVTEESERRCAKCGTTISAGRFRRHALYCTKACRQSVVNDLHAARMQAGVEYAPINGNMVGAIGELQVATDLLKRGFLVFRNVASSGFADMVAVNPLDMSVRFIDATTGTCSPATGQLNHPVKPDKRLTHVAVVVRGTNEVVYKPALDAARQEYVYVGGLAPREARGDA